VRGSLGFSDVGFDCVGTWVGLESGYCRLPVCGRVVLVDWLGEIPVAGLRVLISSTSTLRLFVLEERFVFGRGDLP